MIGVEFAEDIVQDTFLTIWNNKQSFDNILSLKSYLYTSVQNKCLNVIRTNQQFEKYKVEQSAALDEEYILDEEVISQLYQTIDLLPDHYKEVMLKSMEGESIAKIALSMDTTEDAIKAYKRRAKQILKKNWETKPLSYYFYKATNDTSYLTLSTVSQTGFLSLIRFPPSTYRHALPQNPSK